MSQLIKPLILAATILISSGSSGQTVTCYGPTSNDSIDKNQPLIFVHTMPEFTEGDLKEFIQKNLVYPKDICVQGKVFVKFVVEIDGTITDLKIVRGIHPSADEEAMRVIKLTNGKWKCGFNKDTPARVYKTIAIEFKLTEDNKYTK